MADLIDRQAAIDALDQIFDRCEEIEAHLPEGDPDRTGYKMYPDYMTVWKYLHQSPSAQPEIIRCKECKYRDPEYKYCGCGHDIIWQLPRDDNWFCADGKRMGDDPSHPFADDVMMGERKTDE